MALKFEMSFDKAAAKSFMDAVHHDVKKNGRTLGKSLEWGGRKICESLAKQTPQMKKGLLRPVVENPDGRWKRDARRAPFGVMKLRQEKPPVFVPIYRTGEYGKVKFFGLDNAMLLVRTSKTTWKMKPASEYSKHNQFAMKSTSVMKNPKRKIPRGGLAKRSWRNLMIMMGRSNFISVLGVPSLGIVRWTNISTNPTLTIINKVSYMTKILKGSSAVSQAMDSAAKGMMYQIENNLQKAFKHR